MTVRHLAAGLALLFLLPGPARAGHHRWDITEVFSGPKRKVQFIEMFSENDNEAALGSFTLTTNAKSFNFVTNLPSSATANTWVLIATSDFAELPGAPTPDYVIPAGFVNTNGDTINYANGADVVVLGPLPTDGETSVDRNGVPGPNSPTNFAGDSGSVTLNLSIPTSSRLGLVVLVGALLLVALRFTSPARGGRPASPSRPA